LKRKNKQEDYIIEATFEEDVMNEKAKEIRRILGMNENGSNSLELYPNPSSDQITIKTDEVLTGKVFEVYDQVGKLILKGTLTGTKTSIQLNGIANGMYSIQIEDLAKRIFIVN
jgi:hypothetical protein